MTESQMEDIYSQLNTLTQKVNSLELLTGTIGTSQAAIAQIYSRLDTFAETTSNNFTQVTQRFDSIENRLSRIESTQSNHGEALGLHSQVLNNHTQVLNSHTELLNAILDILRDRNGGSGL